VGVGDFEILDSFLDRGLRIFGRYDAEHFCLAPANAGNTPTQHLTHGSDIGILDAAFHPAKTLQATASTRKEIGTAKIKATRPFAEMFSRSSRTFNSLGVFVRTTEFSIEILWRRTPGL
jgi:hypothetical protein